MSDSLNQDEINALMETFNATGGQESSKTSDKQVRVYDFARPDKFSKDHLRALNSIHSKHGTSFASAMAASLRIQTRADLLAVDQLTYREYCASVPESTLFIEVDLKPLTSTAIFEFNPLLVSLWVDLLAGGSVVEGRHTPPAYRISTRPSSDRWWNWLCGSIPRLGDARWRSNPP